MLDPDICFINFLVFSPFVFPTPQQTIDISQSPRQHSGSQTLLERKISADGIALLNSGNASVYHLAEVSVFFKDLDRV